jgi:RNase P subunit RPR2
MSNPAADARPVVMAPGDDLTHIGQRLRSLEHCALHRRTIKLTCPTCQHERRFDAVALWWLYEQRGWNDHLPRAYRRLYCEACLVKLHRVVRPIAEITRDKPDAEQPPYPEERTWKKLVSRYRS